MSTKPLPNVAAPGIRVQLTDESYWTLNDSKAESFTMLVFYRGRHCPKCEKQLKELNALAEEFEKVGTEIVAMSVNGLETAQETEKEWGLDKLKIGCGLSEIQIRDWGLYSSESIKDGEPEMFSEPGLFLVDSSGLKLFYASITSMPFGRPSAEEMLEAIRFINEESYPARGTKPAELTWDSIS